MILIILFVFLFVGVGGYLLYNTQTNNTDTQTKNTDTETNNTETNNTDTETVTVSENVPKKRRRSSFVIRYKKTTPKKQSNSPPTSIKRSNSPPTSIKRSNSPPTSTKRSNSPPTSTKKRQQKYSKNSSVERPDNGTLLASGVSLNWPFAHKASANELLIDNQLCASIQPHDYVVVKPASGDPAWTAILNYPKAGVKGNCRVHLNQYDEHRELQWNSVMTDHVAHTHDTVDIYTI